MEPISKTLSGPSGRAPSPASPYATIVRDDRARAVGLDDPEHDPDAATGVHALLDERVQIGFGGEVLCGERARRHKREKDGR